MKNIAIIIEEWCIAGEDISSPEVEAVFGDMISLQSWLQDYNLRGPLSDIDYQRIITEIGDKSLDDFYDGYEFSFSYRTSDGKHYNSYKISIHKPKIHNTAANIEAIMSEPALQEWNSKEEDEAWAYLNDEHHKIMTRISND